MYPQEIHKDRWAKAPIRSGCIGPITIYQPEFMFKILFFPKSDAKGSSMIPWYNANETERYKGLLFLSRPWLWAEYEWQRCPIEPAHLEPRLVVLRVNIYIIYIYILAMLFEGIMWLSWSMEGWIYFVNQVIMKVACL